MNDCCIFLNGTCFIQGFNATLTEPLDAHGRRVDQFKEMQLKLHPDIKDPLKKLCDDPRTTIVVLSGSDRSLLDEVISSFQNLSSFQNPLSLANASYWLISPAELWWIQYVVGGRAWHVFTFYSGRMDDNNAWKSAHGLGWQCKGAS